METVELTHTFTLARPFPQSYWVVPARILAGEYPGSLLIQEARTKLRALLELGVDTFIDLTLHDHLEPYEPILRMEAARMGKSFTVIKMGVRDLSVPSQRDMKRILDTIDSSLKQNHNLYIHCWGGIGRTGTVVGCYLARHGLTGNMALQEVERLRSVVHSSRPSPETGEQRRMVANWQAGR